MALTTENSDILISIVQVSYLGEPSHWEGVATVKGQVVCEGTGPTYFGVLDLLLDAISDDDGVVNQDWLNFNANNK